MSEEILQEIFGREPCPLYTERLGPHYAHRILPDGREAVVAPLTFGRAKLTVGPAGKLWFDDAW